MRGLEKNCMGRGQTHTQTHTRTCRLLDQLGPEGRVGENQINGPNLCTKWTNHAYNVQSMHTKVHDIWTQKKLK